MSRDPRLYLEDIIDLRSCITARSCHPERSVSGVKDLYDTSRRRLTK